MTKKDEVADCAFFFFASRFLSLFFCPPPIFFASPVRAQALRFCAFPSTRSCSTGISTRASHGSGVASRALGGTRGRVLFFLKKSTSLFSRKKKREEKKKKHEKKKKSSSRRRLRKEKKSPLPAARHNQPTLPILHPRGRGSHTDTLQWSNACPARPRNRSKETLRIFFSLSQLFFSRFHSRLRRRSSPQISSSSSCRPNRRRHQFKFLVSLPKQKTNAPRTIGPQRTSAFFFVSRNPSRGKGAREGELLPRGDAFLKLVEEKRKERKEKKKVKNHKKERKKCDSSNREKKSWIRFSWLIFFLSLPLFFF